MLGEIFNTLQKHWEGWFKQRTKSISGRHHAMQDQKKEKSQAEKELQDFEVNLWKNHLDEKKRY